MAIGFETTAPSTAMTVLRAAAEGLENFSVFCNHVTIIPAIKAILDSPDLRLDGFIGPGHVSTVIGCRPYEFIARDYGKPVVVAGFEPLDILQSIYMLMLQLSRGPLGGGEPVHPGGAVGRQPGRAAGASARPWSCGPTSSGAGSASSPTPRCKMRPEYAAFDAELLFDVPGRAGRRPQGMPVRRGAQGRAQAVGVQGLRHRVHARDADRHLHGVPGGRLRRLLQLRPADPHRVGSEHRHDPDGARTAGGRGAPRARAGEHVDQRPARLAAAAAGTASSRCSTASTGPAAAGRRSGKSGSRCRTARAARRPRR